MFIDPCKKLTHSNAMTNNNTLIQRAEAFQEANLLRSAGLYAFFQPMKGSEGTKVNYDGQELIMTGSNNYLGLTHDPRVVKAAKEAVDRFGTGCTGSRFLNGNSILHNELEHGLAEFVEKEAGLVMTTGFLANYAAIGTLMDEGDFILSDSENHASIIAGCKSSKATTVTYEHNNMADLRKKMSELPAGATKMIVADGVFSMTGEIVDLPGLVAVKKDFPNTLIMLDDAHALGVLGKQGRGTADHFGLTSEVDFITATFSKSFASLGGFVAGPALLIDFLRHKARGFIFSAALPPSATATALKVLELLKTDSSILERLQENVQFMQRGFKALGIKTHPSQTPIISIMVGDELKALQLVKALKKRGVFSTPVMFPAVAFGQAMIRTSYMATHTRAELIEVLRVWKELAEKFSLLESNQEESEVPAGEKRAGYGFEVLAEAAHV